MSTRRRFIPLLSLLIAACGPLQTQQTTQPAASAAPTAMPSNAPAAVASQPPAVQTYSLTGTVSDETTSGVDGASVTATLAGASQPAATATTAKDGAYRLDLPPGTYSVTATKPAWTARTQNVTVSGNGELDFGNHAQAYFISSIPEIGSTQIKEDAPGGPMTITCTISAPITADGQQQFLQRFIVRGSTGLDFLHANQSVDAFTANTASFDSTGTVFTLHFPGHYLASGAKPAIYQVYLRQAAKLGETDPDTNGPAYEDMGINAQNGKPLGDGRADAAFVNPVLSIQPDDLNSTVLAHTFSLKLWRLTHTSTFQYTALKDTTRPAVVSASVQTEQNADGGTYDQLILHMNKPMEVAKDGTTEQFTQLDRTKNLITVNTTPSTSNGQPQTYGPNNVAGMHISATDPTLVYLDLPFDAFKDVKTVDFTLGPDFLDPVGNAPDTSVHTTITL